MQRNSGFTPFPFGRIFPLWAALPAIALCLGGCTGTPLPPVEVTLPVTMDVTIPAASMATGSVDVSLGAFCGLFNQEDLDARVREAAGDLIADLVTVTSVELASTNIVATDGTFAPFTSARLTLTILELGGETLLLGAAANNAGLGTEFFLTQDTPVDLLNDLEEDQCGSPTLHLEGAAILEPRDITFDASVTVLVYTQFR